MQNPDSAYLKTSPSDGNRHFVTGVVASQTYGVKCLELCATNDTNDLIDKHCVQPMLGSCCGPVCQTSPTNVMHLSPP